MPNSHPSTNRSSQATGALNPGQLQEALKGCDREPIHIPGSVQPHGYLLVLSQEFEILKVSENFAELVEAWKGKHLSDFVVPKKLEELKTLVGDGALKPIRYTALALELKESCPNFDAVVHRSGTYLILELEPHNFEDEALLKQDFYQEAMEFSVELQKVNSQGTLYNYVVNRVRKLTGFDRVKLYRFDEDWNGEVVAESKALHMSSYLGLHFPASDIPKQARTLYAKNYLRMIPNVQFNPSVIVPNAHTQQGEPIDLSFSVLRSVSPVHMQYLHNMGIAASMSISVLQNGRLWGLIACHHNTPYRLPYPVRMAAELMAHTFSAFLSNFMQSDFETELQEKEACVRELSGALSPDRNLMETLKHKHAYILKAANADGVIVHIDGKNFAFGLIPEMTFAQKLIDWLETNHDGEVFATDSIARDTSLTVQGQAMASGVLAIPVSTSMRNYLMWFRQEQAEEVSWAGKPEKSITKTEAGYHLTPRASFGRWKENVRGYSKPWNEGDIEAGKSITKLLLNKKYEDMLRQADCDLQSVLDNSNAYIYITDVEGQLLKMNESFLEALGLQLQDIVGKHYTDVFGGELGDMMAAHQAQVIAEQRSLTFDKDFIFKGKQFNLATVKFPLYDTSGDMYALCSISTDIAHLRKTQYELERSNKELERVAFIASHDLQEPIRMISSFSKLLKEDYKEKLDDRAQEYLNFMLSSAERMRTLIQDLLQYSRIGTEEAKPTLMDVEEELTCILKQFTLSPQYAHAQINIQKPLPRIAIKAEHFACLIQNLVGNALKYCHETRAPRVSIECEVFEDKWQVTVSDNGIGIAEAHLGKIFGIFQRLHKKSEYEGTGIGLALCERIVERYGGEIWAESELDVGSTFHFTIPKPAE